MKKIFFIVIAVLVTGCAGQRHASRGWDHLKDKEYEQAIIEFEQAKQSNNRPGAYLGLSRTYFRMGNESKGVESLNEGLKVHPEDGFINWDMGSYLLHRKNDPCGALPYLLTTQKSRVGKGTASKMIESDVSDATRKCNKPVNKIYSEVKPRAIRDVVFEPRSTIVIEKQLAISIPDTWTREKIMQNDKDVAYTFADMKPEFAPSVMIKVEKDDGTQFESIKEKYIKRAFGKNADHIAEQNILYKYLDPAASKKYIVYGENTVAGNAMISVLHYKEQGITVVVILTLIYVNNFSEDEWEYIVKHSANIISSFRMI
jgi:tetratricopeptide (TPR) repeat protein